MQEEKEHLLYKDNSLELASEDFTIDEVYRYEGMSDAADESIVFAISSLKHDIKGLVQTLATALPSWSSICTGILNKQDNEKT